MKFPNKVISFNESIISKFALILNTLKEKGYTAIELFHLMCEQDIDIPNFIDILDCLFALNKITFDKTDRLQYVK
ncbi:MAG: hypothetical protein LBU60_06465 [Clostridiales bacterium]|jgi:hypothetical protein|nr:hypothetical protein [Clostridiales bacterium]